MLFHQLSLLCFTLSLLLAQASASLYGVTWNGDFVKIDRDTGALLGRIGTINEVNFVNGGVVDSSGRLLTTDSSGNAVYEIDPQTATLTKVIDIVGFKGNGATDVRSLAMNSQGKLYFGGNNGFLSFPSLWTIDLVTGAASLIRNLAPVNCQGLAFDNGDVLYCLDIQLGLFEVDTTTGDTTHLEGFPSLDIQTLEFDSRAGKMLGARRALYELDLDDHSVSRIGQFERGLDDVRGLFLVDEEDHGACEQGYVMVQVVMHCVTCADDGTLVRIKNSNKGKYHSFVDLPNSGIVNLSGCVPDNECIHVKIKDFHAGDGLAYEIFHHGVPVAEESDLTRTQKVERVGPHCEK